MSKPQNMLGKFDTYAYHHILMVCDSTQTAEALATTIEITKLQHPSQGGRYSAREVKDGKYITLIDGLTDARFFITNARWSTIIASDSHVGKGNIPQSTTMATDGELEIVEPLGASFLNRLTDICDELETDPVGLIFLLKTIFVGRNTNGSTEMITTIRPMMFVAYDITALFDSSGAKYKMSFVGLTNGAGKLPQPNKIFEGLSFEMKSSLIDTFKALENSVNTKYDEFKKKASAEFAKTLEGDNTAGTAREFLIENYRDVKYKIIANDYSDESKYKAGDLENVRIADKRDGATLNYGPSVGIEEILNRIMQSSSGVIADGKTPKDKFIYKIISTLKSTPTEYVLEYHVNRYSQAISPYDQQRVDGQIIPLPGQSIEFNYIFTGKNVDIKNFDIKMEMGMAFFQIAATTNNVPTQKEAVSGNTTKLVQTTGSDQNASTGTKLRGRTPLFLGTTISQTPMRNTKKPIDSASFQALLERHAALENVSASMTIYGNPQLLDEMAILPSEVESQQTEEPKKDATVNPQWMSTPTLIKVNIKMPVDANDVNTEYEDFWYSGYYTLLEVENIFEDGVFTQELGMYSIPINSQFDDVTDETQETAGEVTKNATATTTTTPTNNTAAAPANKKTIKERQAARALKDDPGKNTFKVGE